MSHKSQKNRHFSGLYLLSRRQEHTAYAPLLRACAADHADELDGLVLLAAYSTRDLTETGLAVLSVYGSEDGVLDMKKYEQYRSSLPTGTSEVVIDGGCHAGFGLGVLGIS